MAGRRGAVNPSACVRALGALAALAATVLFAWWGTWNAGYVFDDLPAIAQNDALLTGDWWRAAFSHEHQPFANRPLSTLTLAVDFAVFGEGPFAAHVGNLVWHLACGVLLWRIARCLGVEGGCALALAAIWLGHPLASDAVAYATQRSTLVFSACLLAAVLATLRRRRWLAVAFTALGMAAKEDMVVAPFVLVACEVAFSGRGLAALREHVGSRVALALSWLVLWACVANGPANATVGFATEPQLTALDWLRTQAGVVLHYLRLVVWPHPLRGAYDTDYVREWGPALLPGALVLGVLVATQLQWRRRPWLAWLGLAAFLLLAPTSTVMPIRSEVVAERRMYLPMLLVLAPLVLLGARWLRAASATARVVASVAAVVVLGSLARSHAAVYRDEVSFWADAFDKRTVGSRSHLAAQILGNQAAMLLKTGRHDESHQLIDAAMQCEAPTYRQCKQYAVSLQLQKRGAEAVAVLEEVVRLRPQDADAHALLGICLVYAVTSSPRGGQQRLAQRAEATLRRAVELDAGRYDAWNSLGRLLVAQRRLRDAAEVYARATETTIEAEPFERYAEVLHRLGRTDEIAPLVERLASDPRHAERAAALRRTVASWRR